MDQFPNAQAPGNQAPGGLTPPQSSWQAGPGAPQATPGWTPGVSQPGVAGWQAGQASSQPGYAAAGYSGVLAQNSLGATVIGKATKWTALPIIAVWFKVLAWISLIGGALGFIIALIVGLAAASNPYVGGAAAGGGFIYGIFLLIGGAYGFLWNLFFSEIIGVFLAIEKNTRKE